MDKQPKIDQLDELSAKEIIEDIYNKMFYDEEEGKYDVNKEVCGSELVQFITDQFDMHAVLPD